MSEISAFFERLPPITRNLFINTIVISTTCVFFPDVTRNVLLDWSLVVYNWQVWRPFTAFFWAPMTSLGGLMEIYSLYNFSRGVEAQKFSHHTVDYGFYLFLMMSMIITFSTLFSMPSLLPSLVGSLLYTWSRANRFGRVNINFIEIPADYLPLATLAFDFLLQHDKTVFFSRLAGMVFAYFYQCLESRSLGPVYKFICDSLGLEQGRSNPTNRVGTVHTLDQVDGYLSAPKWFQKLAGAIPTQTAPVQKGKVNTIHNSSGGSRATSGFSTGFGGSKAFGGTGHKLGSS